MPTVLHRPPEPTTALPKRPALAERWIPLLLVAVTLAAFSGVLTHGFSPIDDVSTISQNPKFNPPHFTPDGLLWYWTHPHMGLYVPVTYTVWGLLAKATWTPTLNAHGLFLSATIFHAASLLMHVITVLAAYALLRQLTARAWPAAAGAVLFAIHPLQVETVAWASGLKDVMFAGFSILSLCGYVAAANGKLEDRRANYWLGLLCLLIALLCKPTAMVTPLLAVVIDLLILRRSARTVFLAALPWFTVVLPLAIIAKLAQPGAAIAVIPIWQRPIVAGGSLAFYLWKLALPTHLTFDYGWRPLVMLQHHWFWAIAMIPLLLLITCFIVARRAKQSVAARGILAGACISVIALLPVLGFVPFMFQAYSTVADHYAYLAMLGPAMVLAFALSTLPAAWWRTATIVFTAIELFMATTGALQLRHWKDEPTLLTHMLAINPRSLLAHNGLGKFHQRRRDWPAAEREYQAALAIDAAYLPARENLVNLYSYLSRPDEAIDQINRLIERQSDLPANERTDFSGAFFEVGQMTLSQGLSADAVRYLTEAVRLHPEDQNAQKTLQRAKAKAATDRPMK